VSKYTHTKNYIKEYKDFVPKELATNIIYQRNLSFDPATTGGGQLSTHRNCLIKALDPKFNKEVANLFMKAFKNYIKEFRFFNSIKGEYNGVGPCFVYGR
jgi:hypothetical protein